MKHQQRRSVCRSSVAVIYLLSRSTHTHTHTAQAGVQSEPFFTFQSIKCSYLARGAEGSVGASVGGSRGSRAKGSPPSPLALLYMVLQ